MPERSGSSTGPISQPPPVARILPAVVAGLGGLAFVGSIIGGLTATQNEVGQALAVMTPITALILTAAYGLRRGTSWGYRLWEVLLGALVFVAAVSFATVGDERLGPATALFAFGSVIYVWRVNKRETGPSRADRAYLALVGVVLLLGLVWGGTAALRSLILVALSGGLVLGTYEVSLRRWCRVGPFRALDGQPPNQPLQPPSGSEPSR